MRSRDAQCNSGEWPLSWLSQQWVATAPIYILFVTTVSSAFPVLRLDIHICVLVVGITVGNTLLNLRLGLLRSWTSRCLFALHRYGSEVVRIQFCAIITLVNSALFVLWVSSAFLSFVPSLVNLRPARGREKKKDGELWGASLTIIFFGNKVLPNFTSLWTDRRDQKILMLREDHDITRQ